MGFCSTSSFPLHFPSLKLRHLNITNPQPLYFPMSSFSSKPPPLQLHLPFRNAKLNRNKNTYIRSSTSDSSPNSGTNLVLFSSAITVTFAVANRVFYKLALVPMKHYPFFLAQFTTFGYVLVYFTILYMRYRVGIVTQEKLSIPKLPFLAIGFLEALGAATGMSAAAILPGPVIPILNQDQASGKVIARGPKVGRLFPLQFSPRILSFACNGILNKVEDWHRKLGHPNSTVLSHVLKSGLLNNKIDVSTFSLDCSVCKLAKSKILPFPSKVHRAEKCFDLIHSDVWGISPVLSHAKYKYFVTFIDDYSRFTWIYFLRLKSEVFSVFQKFLAHIDNQFHTCIKTLRSDSGGEYISHDFQEYLQQKGIISQRSCPYTPQQNGVAERKNRHLLDVTRTLLLQASVPSQFWVEALSSAVFLINRLPTQVLEFDSPFFRLYNTQPTYDDLHTFGCVCFVHLPPPERHKLGAQSVQCAFMGYAPTQKGFICYDASAQRLRISRNVVFFDHQYFFPAVSSGSPGLAFLPHFYEDPRLTERWKPGHVFVRRQLDAPPLDTVPPPDPPPVALRRSNRTIRPPTSGSNAGQMLSEVEFFWPAMMIIFSAFQAGASVIKESVFIDSATRLKHKSLDIFVVNSFGSGFQALFVLLFLPIISNLKGIALVQLPSYLKSGAGCFLNLGADKPSFDGAPLLPVLYIITNLAFNISLLNVVKTSSAVVASLIVMLSVPIAVYILSLPLPCLPEGTSLSPLFGFAILLCVCGLYLYNTSQPAKHSSKVD